MSSNRSGASPDQVTTSASTLNAPYTCASASASTLAEDATVQDAPPDYQFGQDQLNYDNSYPNFIADDSITYQNFEHLFALPSESDSRLFEDSDEYQSSIPNIPQSSNVNDDLTESGMGKSWEADTTDSYPQYALLGTHMASLDDTYRSQGLSHSGLATGQRSAFERDSQNQLQTELRGEQARIDHQPGSRSGSTEFLRKPQRPALLASTSSEEYSTTPTTCSGSPHAQSTPDNTSASSNTIPKLRRGRPPLYPPLPTYEFRPQITRPEPSHPSEADPLAPASIPLTESSVPPKPRRGRPPLYARSPSTLTSTQEAAREHNRLAAQRFRARQDAYTATLNAQAEDLELKNKNLKDEVARLREERLELRGSMLEHGNCGCDVMETYLKGETKRLRGNKEEDEDSKEKQGEE